MKQDFTDHDLHELADGANLIWFWLPTTRKSGGILLGVNYDSLEVEEHVIRDFSICATIRDRRSNYRRTLIIVYGPAHHDNSTLFLEKLDLLCSNSSLPLLLGADFNLIRCCEEKSTENYSLPLTKDFNNFIGVH